jgi:serine protease Do
MKDEPIITRKFLILIIVISLGGGAIGGALASKHIDISSAATVAGTSAVKVTDEDSAIVNAVKKTSPSVVSITGTGTVTGTSFFGQQEQQQESTAGTGFIVRSDGLIITNKHVVSDQNGKYKVNTADGKSYDATIVATDPTNDIALVKISASNLPVVQFGDSSQVVVGQQVIAIGNALGQYQNSVTSGVVSGVGRSIEAGDETGTSTEQLDNVIQTDAAINEGNSGGPLIDLADQVIGMNTATDQSGESIGFALPANLLTSAIASYDKDGKIERPFLGVRYVQITPELAASQNLSTNSGVILEGDSSGAAVVSGSPADKAGLQSGDIITKIGSQQIDDTHSLSSIIQSKSIGDTITITYIRGNSTKHATATLTTSP